MVPEVGEASSIHVIVGRDAQVDILDTLFQVCKVEIFEASEMVNSQRSHLSLLHRPS